MLIAILNGSSLVSNADVEVMINAIQKQLNLHFLPAYNQCSIPIKFYANENDVPGFAWVIRLIDEDRKEPDALGYHQEEKCNNVGRVDGYVLCKPILSNGGTVLLFDPTKPSQYSVSATLSHEVLETCGNRYCSAWYDRGDGVLVAGEVCDPVEEMSYGVEVNGVSVACSDFVFQSYWNPLATLPTNAPLNYLKTLDKPFSILQGGYQICRRDGREFQVFGDAVPEWRKATKMKSFSRASRRLVK